MDDLISRQAAIDALITPYGILYPIRTIESVPPAQPERKKGKWIHGKEIARDHLSGGFTYIEYEDFHCSECGYTVKHIRWNVDGELIDRYCSFCGADMREEGDNEP